MNGWARISLICGFTCLAAALFWFFELISPAWSLALAGAGIASGALALWQTRRPGAGGGRLEAWLGTVLGGVVAGCVSAIQIAIWLRPPDINP